MSEAALIESKPFIREATLRDAAQVARLGAIALKVDKPENMVISNEKLLDLAKDCIYNTNNYCWISEKDGQVVAALSAQVHPQLVFERKQASVVQFYTIERGEGIKLIRNFLAWARPQPKIKSIVFMLESGADPRIGKMLQRLGLRAEMPVYVEWM